MSRQDKAILICFALIIFFLSFFIGACQGFSYMIDLFLKAIFLKT